MRKSRFNESQRQAIVDSHLKGSVLPPLIWYQFKVEILV